MYDRIERDDIRFKVVPPEESGNNYYEVSVVSPLANTQARVNTPGGHVAEMRRRDTPRKEIAVRKAARDPETLEELFTPDQPLRPTFRLVAGGQIYYAPEFDGLSLSVAVPLLQGYLLGIGVSERRFVRSLLIIERAKRRITFANELTTLRVPRFMTDNTFLQINPKTKTLDVWIDSEDFRRTLDSPEMESLLTGTVGHEFGHVAKANGRIPLRPDTAEPENGRVRRLVGVKRMQVGRSEILSDLMAKELAGVEGYVYYLLANVRGAWGKYMLFKEAPFRGLRIAFDGRTAFNLLTYFLVLADNTESPALQKARSWLAAGRDEMKAALGLRDNDGRALYDYYATVLESHQLPDGIILESVASTFDVMNERQIATAIGARLMQAVADVQELVVDELRDKITPELLWHLLRVYSPKQRGERFLRQKGLRKLRLAAVLDVLHRHRLLISKRDLEGAA